MSQTNLFICPKCGGRLEPDTQTCPYCGYENPGKEQAREEEKLNRLKAEHREKMRNHELQELKIANEILDQIKAKGEFVISEEQHSDTRLISVIHALEREDLIKGDGTRFTSK